MRVLGGDSRTYGQRQSPLCMESASKGLGYPSIWLGTSLVNEAIWSLVLCRASSPFKKVE